MRKDEKTPEWLNTNACLQNLNTFLEPASTFICVLLHKWKSRLPLCLYQSHLLMHNSSYKPGSGVPSALALACP